MDGGAIEHRKPGGAIGQKSLALGRADRLAQVGFRVQAVFAFTAFRRIKRDHMIAHFKAGDTFANLDHNTSALMSEYCGENTLWVITGSGKFISMAQSSGLDFNQNFAGAGPVKFDLHHFQWLACFECYCGSCSHLVSPPC